MDRSLLQPWKAPAPYSLFSGLIEVTVEGICSSHIGQPLKAPLLMVVTPSEITIDGIWQPAKAHSPMVATPEGMTMESLMRQLLKASSPNFVKASGRLKMCSKQ